MRILWAMVVAAALSGCAQPRVINTISIHGDDAKLLYSQRNTLRTGLIQCGVSEAGDLTDCRTVPITFDSGKGKP